MLIITALIVQIVMVMLIIKKEIPTLQLQAAPIFMAALIVQAMTKMVTELEAKVTGI